MTFRYLDTFSGIGSASVAWEPFGWQCLAHAEIDAFAKAVLKFRFPDVPDLGDATRFKEWPDYDAVDLVCGGTPCQSFSIAGLRAGLADPRGQLTLTFLAIIDRYRLRWVVWENTLGVLNDDGGRSFASIIGALGLLGYGWSYRCLDAQYVRVDGLERAVPQRRRRVFLVGYTGDWRRAAAVLFEPARLQGNTPPRRKSGKRIAPPLAARASGGGGHGTDFDVDGGLVGETAPSLLNSGRGVRNTGETRGQDPLVAELPAVANGLTRRMHKGINTTADEGQTMIAVPILEDGPAHTLTADGFDASEDGTGRGPPLIPEIADPITSSEGKTWQHGGKNHNYGANHGLHNVVSAPLPFDTTQVTSPGNISNPKPGDPCHPLAAEQHPPAIAVDLRNGAADEDGPAMALQAGGMGDERGRSINSIPHTIAFSGKDHAADANDEVAPTMRAMGHDASHANAGGQLAVAFQPRVARNGRGSPDEVASALTAEPGSTGKGDSAQVVAQPVSFTFSERSNKVAWEKDVYPSLMAMPQTETSNMQFGIRQGWAVRRLMPVECERLMGLPDDWTDVPWRGQRHPPDGPRYKALGNAWAVNCARWIGERIAWVDLLFDDAEQQRIVEAVERGAA